MPAHAEGIDNLGADPDRCATVLVPMEAFQELKLRIVPAGAVTPGSPVVGAKDGVNVA